MTSKCPCTAPTSLRSSMAQRLWTLRTRRQNSQMASSVCRSTLATAWRLERFMGIGEDPDADMSKVRDLGLATSQVFMDEFEPEPVRRLRQAVEKHQIEATALVDGGPGKEVWDSYQGPLTIGLVPR